MQSTAADRSLRAALMRRVRLGWTPASSRSGLTVHAAALFRGLDGAQLMVPGGNIENGLRSLSMCAERTVIANAIADLGTGAQLSHIAVWSPDPTLPPCCPCRQAIHHASGGCARVSYLENGRWVTRPIAELLPDAPDLTAVDEPPASVPHAPLLAVAMVDHALRGMDPAAMLTLVRTATGNVYRGVAVQSGGALSASATSAAVWRAVNAEGAATRITDVACYARIAVSAPDGPARGIIQEFAGPETTVHYMVGGASRSRSLDELIPYRRVKGPAMRSPDTRALAAG